MDRGAWHTDVSEKECRGCVRGSEGIGKTSMYTRLDEYDVFRNSAQRQTDDGKCSERNAWEDSKARATHRQIRHETRMYIQTLRLRMDARIGNRMSSTR